MEVAARCLAISFGRWRRRRSRQGCQSYISHIQKLAYHFCCAARHSFLCERQCASWHCRPQYFVTKQRLQVLSFFSSSPTFPQPAQTLFVAGCAAGAAIGAAALEGGALDGVYGRPARLMTAAFLRSTQKCITSPNESFKRG